MQASCTRFSTVVWTWVRPVGEQWCRLGPLSIPSEMGHLAMPITFLGKKQLAQARFEPRTFRLLVEPSAVAHYWLDRGTGLKLKKTRYSLFSCPYAAALARPRRRRLATGNVDRNLKFVCPVHKTLREGWLRYHRSARQFQNNQMTSKFFNDEVC